MGSFSNYILLVTFPVLLHYTYKDPEIQWTVQSSQSPPQQGQETGSVCPSPKSRFHFAV